MYRRLTCLVFILCLCAPLCAPADAAGSVKITTSPYKMKYNAYFPGEEYVIMEWSSANYRDTGKMFLKSSNGRYKGTISLPGCEEAVQMKVVFTTPKGKDLYRGWTKLAAPDKTGAPYKGLKDTRATARPEDYAAAVYKGGVKVKFTAPGRKSVCLKVSSPQESHTVTLYAGKKYAYSANVKLPCTYADDTINITILDKFGGTSLLTDSFRAWQPAYDEIVPAKSDRLKGIKVCVDPGHQRQSKIETVDLGPGLSDKATTRYGMAKGAKTQRLESILVLEISLKLRQALLEAGADVIMTRTVQDTFVGMLERADIPNNASADIVLRLHANNSSNTNLTGIRIYIPYKSTYALEVAQPEEYKQMGYILLSAMENACGISGGDCTAVNTYVGCNWSKMPSFLVEMGYMSTPLDDYLLSSDDYQARLVQGMVDGVEQVMRLRGKLQ